MEQSKVKKTQKPRNKTHFLHHLLVFFVCVLVACITWLAVMYAEEQEKQNAENALAAPSDTAELDGAFPTHG